MIILVLTCVSFAKSLNLLANILCIDQVREMIRSNDVPQKLQRLDLMSVDNILLFDLGVLEKTRIVFLEDSAKAVLTLRSLFSLETAGYFNVLTASKILDSRSRPPQHVRETNTISKIDLEILDSKRVLMHPRLLEGDSSCIPDCSSV